VLSGRNVYCVVVSIRRLRPILIRYRSAPPGVVVAVVGLVAVGVLSCGDTPSQIVGGLGEAAVHHCDRLRQASYRIVNVLRDVLGTIGEAGLVAFKVVSLSLGSVIGIGDCLQSAILVVIVVGVVLVSVVRVGLLANAVVNRPARS